MSDHDPQRVVAYDHTALQQRPRRLWTFMDFALPGVAIIPALAGLVAAVLMLPVGLGVLALVGVDGVNWIMYVVAIGIGVAVYFAWGKPLADHMPISSFLLVWLDWAVLQPKKMHGLARDTEPVDLRWQLILWHPTDPGWWAAHDHTLAWLRDHPAATSAERTGR